MDANSNTTEISSIQCQEMQLHKIDPATLEALKTLSIVSANEGVEKLHDCNNLTANLERLRSKRNMRLFEKLDAIRKDFSGLNLKIAKMEESIADLKKGTSNLVHSLPSDGEKHTSKDSNSAR